MDRSKVDNLDNYLFKITKLEACIEQNKKEQEKCSNFLLSLLDSYSEDKVNCLMSIMPELTDRDFIKSIAEMDFKTFSAFRDNFEKCWEAAFKKAEEALKSCE